MKLNKKRIILLVFFGTIALGFAIPERIVIPVKGASASDWNNKSFWYEPWGKSGVHKGIDIFGDKGTPLLSSSVGLVLYSGEVELGGKIVLILGPKWRLHYYAHLDNITTSSMSLVSSGDVIGTVGDTGNAKGKSPHLHYSIATVIPYVWRIDTDSQGWKKIFFLDPNEKLNTLKDRK
jgi:murein DD-endopeptidase MepM/ murein hydrolase activator NlpD